MTPVKRVAVIGAGPAGVITIDAMAQEKAFDLIRVFERRERPGGCWVGDEKPPPNIADVDILASGTSADPPMRIPKSLPAQRKKSNQPRFTESSIYLYLETNVDDLPMSFSQESIPAVTSKWSRELYGPSNPFRPWQVIQQYIQSLVDRRGYQDFVSYNTTVERAEKVGNEWKLTLRKDGEKTDYWWEEWFDAVIVASGHYSVPYIPSIEGSSKFAAAHPGSVIHSKHFRGRDAFKGKRVVVVGASVSAADIAFDLATSGVTQSIYAVMIGHNVNGYFGGEAFNHPLITKKPSITRIDPISRTVYFKDGSSVPEVDKIVFGTGYSWTLPFLPSVEVRNNRVPNLYLHVVYQKDPTLLFVGAVNAGLTFKIFEWQAVFAARLLAGRANKLPPIEEQQRWEIDRIKARGDGAKFALVYPDFEEYFETLRRLATKGEKGKGRQLPPFQKEWFHRFIKGHELRKQMWRGLNAQARGYSGAVPQTKL